MRATNRACELQIEHAECQVEHSNAVMTLMGHRTWQTESSTPWHARIFGATVSHLQAKLPLNNRVLKDLGCLNL